MAATETLKAAHAVVTHEAKHLVRVFASTWCTGGIGCAALLALWLIVNFTVAEPSQRGDVPWPVMIVAALIYGVILGAQIGLAVAVVRLVWIMVAGWIVVPLVVVPLALSASFWLFSGVLGHSMQLVLAALSKSAAGHEWLVGALGPAARIGPPILVIALPFLAVDLLQIVADPGVLWSLCVLVLGTAVAFFVGAIPSVGFSIALLGGVWVRRMRARAAATHATAQGSSAPGVGASAERH